MAETRSFVSVSEAKPPFFVGIDLGGTNIKVGVVDDRGQFPLLAQYPHGN